MNGITLTSVFNKLIKEERQEASDILKKWFAEQCVIVEDVDTVKLRKTRAEQGQNDARKRLDKKRDTDITNGLDDLMKKKKDTKIAETQTDENLSPISGINTASDNVDDFISPTNDGHDDPNDNDIDLEDRVEDLEGELQQLKSEISSLTGDETDTDKEHYKFNFEDLEESFALEKIESNTDPNHNRVYEKGLLPNVDLDKRIAGRPIEIDSKTYDGHDRQQSPTVEQAPLRKNQMARSTAGREKVDKGPKNALLNREQDLYPHDSKNSSIIGGAHDLRGDAV